MLSRKSLFEEVIEKFSDIMMVVEANAECIKRGKETCDRNQGFGDFVPSKEILKLLLED